MQLNDQGTMIVSPLSIAVFSSSFFQDLVKLPIGFSGCFINVYKEFAKNLSTKTFPSAPEQSADPDLRFLQSVLFYLPEKKHL